MPTEADRVFRDNNRYTGDGLPGEPVAAPLPFGDPSSGVKPLRKSEIRGWANSYSTTLDDKVTRAELAADRAEATPNISNPGGYYSPASATTNIDDWDGGDTGLVSTVHGGTFPNDTSTSFWWIATQRIYSTGTNLAQTAIRYLGTSIPSSPKFTGEWKRVKGSSGLWSPWVEATTQNMRIENFSRLIQLQKDQVPVGGVVEIHGTGYAYQRVSDSAIDAHIDYSGVSRAKWKVIPIGGVYHMEAWGDISEESLAQKAIYDVALIAEAKPDRWPFYTLQCHSTINVKNGLKLLTIGGVATTGMNIDLSTCSIKTLTGGTITPIKPALEVAARDCEVKLPFVACNSLSSAIHIHDCLNAEIYPLCVAAFGSATVTGFGYSVTGSMDNSTIHGGWGYQWGPSDANYNDLLKWTGVLWDINAYDFNMVDTRGGWCKIPLRIGASCQHLWFDRFHCWQGRSGMAATTINPILIENHSTANGVTFTNAYFDNGIIHDYKSALNISNCKFLEWTVAVTITGARMKRYCPNNGAIQAAGVLTANRCLSVEYVTGTAGQVWGMDLTHQSDWFDESELAENSVNQGQRVVNIYTRSDDVPVEQHVRFGGAMSTTYQSGTSDVKTVIHDPINDIVRMGFGNLVVGEWKIHGSTNTLTVAAGSITPTAHFHLVDTEGGAATDDITNIATTGIADGTLLVLSTANNARDLTIKHNAGNIFCGSDRVLDTTADTITLVKVGVYWRMTAFSDNL